MYISSNATTKEMYIFRDKEERTTKIDNRCFLNSKFKKCTKIDNIKAKTITQIYSKQRKRCLTMLTSEIASKLAIVKSIPTVNGSPFVHRTHV